MTSTGVNKYRQYLLLRHICRILPSVLRRKLDNQRVPYSGNVSTVGNPFFLTTGQRDLSIVLTKTNEFELFLGLCVRELIGNQLS